MSDNGIDSKPKNRVPSARRRRGAALPTPQPNDDLDVVDDQDAKELHVRVKDRSGDDIVTQKKSRIGGLFKETPIKGLLKDAENLKRPLSGIFRRPGSKAGRKHEEDEKDSSLAVHGANSVSTSPLERSVSPSPYNSAPISRPVDYDPVARAPHLPSSQLHGMLQVDQLAMKHPQLAKLDDLDISLLSRFLCIQDEVEDEDVPWAWDYLFASVSTEMREEWAQEEQEDR